MIESADDNISRRFTRVFLIVLIFGLAGSAALALYVDPLATFGTGRLPPLLTNEREDKPKAFLEREPGPQAIVLGTSRVMKFNPACVAELSGIPSFNFGLSNARVEDWVAVVAFYRDRARRPLRELIIGADVDSFDNAETDRRLLSSSYLSKYVGGGSHLSWDTATRALFSMQALHSALTSIQRHFGHGAAAHYTTGPDGFLTYPDWEKAIQAGTFNQDRNIADLARRLPQEVAESDFSRLSPSRVALFRDLVRSAQKEGTVVDVFIPPLHPTIVAALTNSPIQARIRDLDAVLRDLEREGAIRYLKVDKPEDFGGDLAGYFDGSHMMESNTSRLLLKMFGREHGCGR